MPVIALLLLAWALFGCIVVVMMIYGAFEHVAMNDAVMAAVLATGTAFLASLSTFLSAAQQAVGQRSAMTQRPRTPLPALLLSLLFTVVASWASAAELSPGWPVVGGSQGGGHFTPLAEITAANFDRLREVGVAGWNVSRWVNRRAGPRRAKLKQTV
jgi:hypothetical protein